MKNIIFLFILIGLLNSCSDQTITQVENVFYRINQHIINQEGPQVYALADDSTHQHYAKLFDLCLYADSVQVSQLGILDQITILAARSVVSDELLKKMDAKSFMEAVYSDVNIMYDEKKAATQAMRIRNTMAKNNIAQAEFSTDGGRVKEKQHVRFNKENGEWKFNLLSLNQITEEQLNKVLQESSISTHDFVSLALSEPHIQAKIIKPLNFAWYPIVKK